MSNQHFAAPISEDDFRLLAGPSTLAEGDKQIQHLLKTRCLKGQDSVNDYQLGLLAGARIATDLLKAKGHLKITHPSK
jgi:hypothetical protein